MRINTYTHTSYNLYLKNLWSSKNRSSQRTQHQWKQNAYKYVYTVHVFKRALEVEGDGERDRENSYGVMKGVKLDRIYILFPM